MKTRKRLCYAATLLALISLASCGQNDSDDTLLPAGKYPMTFTTWVNGLAATRATTDNSWDGGEQVALQVDGEVKQYQISGTGASATLTSSDPFYWTSTEETKTVKAWYYGDGYSAAELDSWKVEPDQSASDNSAYKASDFLYAPAKNISFGSDNKSLAFYHQTARVVINILKEEAATEASQIKSVAFGEGNNLALSRIYTAPMGKANFGTWDTTSGASMGTITPKEIGTPAGGSYLKSYTALLIPQNMQGKEFIAIKLDDNQTYYYIPEGVDDAKFEAGKEYTYDVTVQYGHLDAVLVSVNGTWGGGDTEEVKSTAPGFSAYDLKIGDYYYSDGSTSDGGYRKYADGTTELLDIEPVLTSENGQTPRTVIGIVYSTDVTRIGKAATDYLKSIGVTTPQGLVMALTNASEGCRWGNNGKDENNAVTEGIPFRDNTITLKQQYNNVDGYAETRWIIDTYGNSNTLKNTYSAFYQASSYGKESGTLKYAAPANTTGWFIPSMGQWWDIMSNLGGINLSGYQDNEDDYVSIADKSLVAVDNINRYLKRIGDAAKFSNDPSNYFWSSSEYDEKVACVMSFRSDGNLDLSRSDKSFINGKMRCVFAF